MFQRHYDEGFSLVEVLIAMFLFAVISLAVLPLLISAVSLSVVNRDVVSATALANDRVAQLRESFPTAADSTRTCAALTAALTDMNADDTVPAGFTIAAEAFVDAGQAAVCPTGADAYPRAVLVTVVVDDSAGGTSTVSTRVTVGAAS
ncbi:prepilin-type N-terminal cleavage/methylation domain-containing protein [uncultured Microbacterium sp.]|uniref:type IV pilus modification PilV family protein n=1 Tax=uncultured Microbacterium sp. TaxID=191216 RepID=UPI00260FA028|nr:prepilin-type N-terminal cleavage/methylation domain-containing protein [uncultured Microbacterium sp.]